MITIILLLAASALAMDVTLNLTNGAVVSGELVSMSNGDYEIILSDGRSVSFKAAEIQSVATNNAQPDSRPEKVEPEAQPGAEKVAPEKAASPTTTYGGFEGPHPWSDRTITHGWGYRIGDQRASWKKTKAELLTVPAAAEALQGEQTRRLLGWGFAGVGTGLLVAGLALPSCPYWGYDEAYVNCLYPNDGKKLALYAGAIAFDIPALILDMGAAKKRKNAIAVHNAGVAVSDGVPQVFIAATW